MNFVITIDCAGTVVAEPQGFGELLHIIIPGILLKCITVYTFGQTPDSSLFEWDFFWRNVENGNY